MADNASITDRLRDQVATVAAAYFSNVHVQQADIPAVISMIATSLASVGSSSTPASEPVLEESLPAQVQTQTTPAQVRKSITPEALVSFEDGRGYKTLKRHLSTRGMTPTEYRLKWGLPSDYPMVAPGYSARRSALAKAVGLGRKPGQTVAPKKRSKAN